MGVTVFTDLPCCGESTLEALADVALLAPADGDLLSYNLAALKWTNVAQSTITAGAVPWAGITGKPVEVTQAASASTSGWLTSTDWSTFNGKQDALTFGNLTGDGSVIGVTGGTGAVIGSGTSLTFTPGNINHANLGGLTTTDAGHTQFALLAGRAGGQSLSGGTAASETLTLSSTANATKGKILLGTSAYDEVNNRLGIGNASPNYALSVGTRTSVLAITPKIFTQGGPIVSQPGAVNSGLGVVTDDFAAGVGSYIFIGLGATTGNTYSIIQSLINGVSNTGDISIQPLGGNVGIGTTTPAEKLDLGSNTLLTTQANITEWRFKNTGIEAKNLVAAGGWARGLLTYTNSSGTVYFSIGGRGTGQTFTYGYIGKAFDNFSLAWTDLLVDIGSTTNNRNFNVYGAALITGNLTVNSNTLFVDATNNRVGIGTASPLYALHSLQSVTQPASTYCALAGTPTIALNAANTAAHQAVYGDITINLNGFGSTGTIRGGSFIARTGGASGGTLNQLIGNLAWTVHNNAGTVTDAIAYFAIGSSNTGGGTITNAYGFRIGQIGAGTNNYALFTEVTANTNKWELYLNGGAQNYIKGNVGIGVTVPLDTLHVAGHIYGDLSHCELYENNNTGTAISLTTAGTYYGWVTATEGLNSGASYADFTDNATADRITIGSLGAGRYLMNIAVSFEGTASTTFTWAVHKNGSPVSNMEFDRTMGTASQTGSGSMSGIVTAAAGDYFDLRVTADGASKTVTVYHAALTMVRIAR